MQRESSDREAAPTMSGYHLDGPKLARMYEVILPKKLGYFGKVQEVLEDLFSEKAIRAVPFRIQQSSECAGTSVWVNSTDLAGSIPLAIRAAAISRICARRAAGSM